MPRSIFAAADRRQTAKRRSSRAVNCGRPELRARAPVFFAGGIPVTDGRGSAFGKQIALLSNSASTAVGTPSNKQRDASAPTLVLHQPDTDATPGRPSRRWLVPVIICIVATIGCGLWFFQLRDRLIVKRFGVVVPGSFYRSGQISRYLIADVIDRYQLGTIVDLNGFDPKDADQQAEADVSRSKGVQHFCFPLRGNGTGRIAHFADAIEAIVKSQQNQIPVLVHCYAGTQRTGACVSFYRLLVLKDRPESVYQELARYGWDAGTDQVLLEYVNSHLRELAGLLVERHVLDKLPETIPTLHP
jgi:hypothetical protein